MIKKMVISMFFMSVITLAAIYTLQLVTGSTLGQPVEENSVTFTFENTDYPFFLTDYMIEEEINKGIESLNTIEDYLLPVNKNTLSDDDDVMFSYIEPPALTVTNKARSTYHQFGRKVRTSEVKNVLMDEYLPFVIRFNENKGYVYNISFQREENIIEPYSQEIKNGGGMVVVYFPVEDIMPLDTGTLHVIDSVSPSKEMVFDVDFSQYFPKE